MLAGETMTVKYNIEQSGCIWFYRDRSFCNLEGLIPKKNTNMQIHIWRCDSECLFRMRTELTTNCGKGRAKGGPSRCPICGLRATRGSGRL